MSTFVSLLRKVQCCSESLAFQSHYAIDHLYAEKYFVLRMLLFCGRHFLMWDTTELSVRPLSETSDPFTVPQWLGYCATVLIYMICSFKIILKPFGKVLELLKNKKNGKTKVGTCIIITLFNGLVYVPQCIWPSAINCWRAGTHLLII